MAELEPGNIDLRRQPRVKNPDGSTSTVRSISINEDGTEILIPTVVGNKVVSDDEAVKEYHRTGKHLGKFKTVKEANQAAKQLHEDYAAGKYDMAENKPEPVGSKMPGELRDIVQKMSDAGEPDENIGTVINKYMDDHDTVLDQTINEFKGVVKGLPSGVWGAIRGSLYDLPLAVYEDTKSLIAGETPENAKAMLDGLANAPKAFKNATHEERGKMIGEMLGGFATAKYAPGTPRAVAKGVGTAAEFTGKKAGWPLRMVGAHALGEGNPIGAAMIAAPEALEGTGRALREWGENTNKKFAPGTVRLVNPTTDKVVATNAEAVKTKTPGAIRIGKPSAKAQAGMRSDVASATAENLEQKFKGAAARDTAAIKEVDAAVAAEKKIAETKRAASAQKEADLKAADIIEKAKQGLTEQPPKVTETVKAPGQTMSTTYAAEDAGLTPLEQELLKRASSVKAAPSGVADRLAPKTEPAPVQANPAVREQAVAAVPAEPVNVPPTRTSRAINETIPALSENDVDAMVDILQKNPGITKEEALAELVNQRGQRQQLYRSEASLSKLEQSALNRDIP